MSQATDFATIMSALWEDLDCSVSIMVPEHTDGETPWCIGDAKELCKTLYPTAKYEDKVYGPGELPAKEDDPELFVTFPDGSTAVVSRDGVDPF